MSMRTAVRLTDKFETLVQRTPTGCWGWRGYLNKAGYGTVGHQGRYLGAHRVSWELHRGPIPRFPLPSVKVVGG